MDHIEYLFAGFAVFWAGLFIYLLALQTRLRSLLREVERLEERHPGASVVLRDLLETLKNMGV